MHLNISTLKTKSQNLNLNRHFQDKEIESLIQTQII